MGSCLSFILFFFIHLSLISAIEYVGADTAPPPQSLPVVIKAARGGAPPKPSVAVIFGILTTFFSLTFLLLLYAKHCRRGVGTATHPGGGIYTGGYPLVDRRNSGIDRVVIDSLPVFRFSSLRGLKDGLECAVCLSRFEPNEVLRLLPKCKHAFHVECVDTWLDAHSTCPLCRYRVDPEDILLVEDIPPPNPSETIPAVSRVSGRHSFAGNSIAETPKAAAARRSLDSWSSRKKKRGETVEVGCFDRPRKDELLLPPPAPPSAAEQRRLEHRIIIAGGDVQSVGPRQSFHRWSDVQRPDLLFLQSEMILSRVSGEGGGGESRCQVGAINGRCVSEITGVSRYRSNYEESNDDRNHRRRRQEGAVSRWTAWISQSRSNTEQQQAVVVNETTTSSAGGLRRRLKTLWIAVKDQRNLQRNFC